MLTVKEINEVSFGKAGFSGYKPEDVDNFIDEVVESFTQLLAERDDALQQEAQLDQQVKELTNQVAQLKAKNAELQKKLGILAQKIESYREEEDGIKEAILSAQKIGKDAIQEAKDKAAVMLADAEENAKALLANARDDAAKAAREYASIHKGADCYTIVTLNNSFHGRTIATLAATGQAAMHRHFGPFPEGFCYAPANDIAAMERLLDGTVCGVLIELIQGEGGVNVLDVAYVRALEQLCRERDVLFMIDEVQTGNGRTGALYAYQLYGVEPDVVTTAKGLAGGLPIGMGGEDSLPAEVLTGSTLALLDEDSVETPLDFTVNDETAAFTLNFTDAGTPMALIRLIPAE